MKGVGEGVWRKWEGRGRRGRRGNFDWHYFKVIKIIKIEITFIQKKRIKHKG